MNWYRKCFANIVGQDPDSPPDVSSIISRSDFERRLQMIFNQYRDALKEDGIMTWKQWLNTDMQGMAMSLDSDFTFYQDFLQNAPEGISTIDLMEAYVSGQLNDANKQQYQFQRSPILNQNVPESPENYPWYPQQSKDLEAQDAINIYQMASQRLTKGNAQQVLSSRKDLFLAFNTDKELANKLGITQSELNKRIRSFAGFTASSRRVHEDLNQGIPSQFQWNGIVNSSFLVRSNISPEDIDKFVKEVKITDENRVHWGSGDENQGLRRHIAGAFMGIDTRISYRNLSFEVGDCSRDEGEGKKYPHGTYHNHERKIKVETISLHTIAHELGHYLDYEFGRNIYDESQIPLSEMSHKDIERLGGRKGVGREKIEWAKKFRSFVDNLRSKGEISSAYYQEAKETFARFVDKFIQWTNKLAGNYVYDDNYSNDKFEENDFRIFVRLLQEKSYIDSIGQ